MHYYIIRSELGLSKTVNRFLDKGYISGGLSVMDIEYLLPTMPVITNNHAFIFTSVHAIEGLMRLWQPTHYHTVFCVGEATGEQAQKAGFTNIITPLEHHAQALLPLIKEQQKYHFIYGTGIYRKSYLEDNLKTLNLKFSVLELYKTHKKKELAQTIINDLQNNDCGAFVCFSIHNAEILYDLLVQYCNNQTLNSYEWHIVGNSLSTLLSLNKVQFYKTPQHLYDYFSV